MRKLLLLAIVCMAPMVSFGQSIDKDWQFSAILDQQGDSLFAINSEVDYFQLKEGSFRYQLEAR